MSCTVITLFLLIKYASSEGGKWDYDNAGNWGEDWPMCNDAPDESPINIDTFVPGEIITDQQICTETFEWDVDFTKQTFKIKNNGYSFNLIPAEEVTDAECEWTETSDDGKHYKLLNSNETAIGRFPNYFYPDYLDGDHHTFCLHGLHFHWGLTDDTGSEHTINGHQYPLEVHFVHFSCNIQDLGTTLSRWPYQQNITDASLNGYDVHEVAVIGVFFDIVEENNPAFDAMFADLENIRFPDEVTGSQTAKIVQGLDLADLISCDLATAGYYAYEGSLTTPPCTDIVRWFVMKARSTIGIQQIQTLRTLMATTNETIAPNFREVQENIGALFECKNCGTLSTPK